MKPISEQLRSLETKWIASWGENILAAHLRLSAGGLYSRSHRIGESEVCTYLLAHILEALEDCRRCRKALDCLLMEL